MSDSQAEPELATFPIHRELVVLTHPQAAIRITPQSASAAPGVDTTPLLHLLQTHGATMTPVFHLTEPSGSAQPAVPIAALHLQVPNLAGFHVVDAAEDRMDALAQALSRDPNVAAAVVRTAPVPPLYFRTGPRLAFAPSTSPDLTALQVYLDAPPSGVGARSAWTIPGGRGAGVEIVDVEYSWRLTHEDLRQNENTTLISGVAYNDVDLRSHGTGVLGVLGGDANTFGVVGICPDARLSVASQSGTGQSIATAIQAAALRLRPGDIIVVEAQAYGPRFNYGPPPGQPKSQEGMIPVEWWYDRFYAIKFATSRGIIVVEAAGNGSQDLDDPLYNTIPPGSPAGWTNPLNRANRDSGAVLVGAGGSPSGTWGAPDRSRLSFSNYGASIDAQGWGIDVTTCGGSNATPPDANEDHWYTTGFNGTSSATPIVAGVIACVQGILRASGLPLLTPATARQMLRETGSPQIPSAAAPLTQRIGNRPDLGAAIAWAREHLGAPRWQPFMAGDKAVTLAVGDNRDGRLEVFAAAADDGLWHIWQTAPNGGWSTWQPFLSGSNKLRTLVVGQHLDGRLDVFGTDGNDNSIWHNVQTVPSGGWVGWQPFMAGDKAAKLAVGRNQDGRLEVFASATDDSLWHIRQTAPNGGWSTWQPFLSGNNKLRTLVVGQQLDGRLDVFGTDGDDNSIWHNVQTAPSGGWVGWQPFMAGDKAAKLAVGRNQDGRLEVFASATDDSLWHIWQTAPNGGWSTWQPFLSGNNKLRTLVVGQHLDGRLDVFGTDGNDNSIWHNVQTAPSGGWVGWQPFMAGDKAATLAVGRSQDGRLEVFACATDASLWHIRQSVVNHW